MFPFGPRLEQNRCELVEELCLVLLQVFQAFDHVVQVSADEVLSEIVQKVFDFRPSAIIRDLDLRRPIYQQTAAYGHFGRDDIDLPWEELNKVDELKKLAEEVSGE